MRYFALSFVVAPLQLLHLYYSIGSIITDFTLNTLNYMVFKISLSPYRDLYTRNHRHFHNNANEEKREKIQIKTEKIIIKQE